MFAGRAECQPNPKTTPRALRARRLPDLSANKGGRYGRATTNPEPHDAGGQSCRDGDTSTGAELQLSHLPDQDGATARMMTSRTRVAVRMPVDRSQLRALRDWCDLHLTPDDLPDLEADGYDWPDLGPTEGTSETVTAEAERHQYGDGQDDYGHPATT